MSHAYNARKKAIRKQLHAAIPILPGIRRLIRSGRVSRWKSLHWRHPVGKKFIGMSASGRVRPRKLPIIVDAVREQVREWLRERANAERAK